MPPSDPHNITTSCLTYWKDLASIFQSVSTTLGVIIAGAWALHRYYLKREKAAKLNINHKISDCHIAPNKRLLHVEVEMANIGDTIFKVGAGLTTISSICPLSDELEKMIKRGDDPVQEGQTEIAWPKLYEKGLKWPEGLFEIEPGEKDSVHYDFIINDDVQTISVCSCFDAIKKDTHPIAWEVTTIYNIGQALH